MDSVANQLPSPDHTAQAATKSEAIQAPGALASYHAKRNFRRTPEPEGALAAPAAEGLRYVIQKHWASHLHYDLRLELNGTMHSWAVPKGPSLDPADKRLAVQVEDHPIAYNRFEGQIPAGQYGAGRVIVWDRGSWSPVGDPVAGLAKGHLKFDLHGIKLRGRWALVRLKDANAKQPPWLLIKDRDAEARPRPYSVTDALPDSVGPSDQDEDARAAPASPPGALTPPSNTACATPDAPDKAKRTLANPSPHAARLSALPIDLAPQLAQARSAPPEDAAAWQWEMKFDGYRLLARVDATGAVRLVTRNGLDWSARMPEVAHAVAALGLQGSWLDGEVVMPGTSGMPDFAALQRAFEERRTGDLVYYLFDAPWLRGTDLTDLPLAERRARLVAALPALAANGTVRLSAVLPPEPRSLLASACGMGLEGVIGKRLDAPYRSGRSDAWIKLKCGQEDEFIIAGFTTGQGARAAQGHLGALVLAAHDPDHPQGPLRWAGNVGSGFTGAALAALQRRLAPLHRDSSPLAPGDQVPGRVQWVQPELVAQVRHAGITPQGHVRQAVYRGLREDKAASEVVLPQIDKPNQPLAQMQPTPAAIQSGASMDSDNVLVGQQLTHPERVIDPASGTTKLDLARYYATVAPLIQPHLLHRPVALVRAPDGLSGELFFQKHAQGQPLAGVTQLPAALDPGHAPLMAIDSAQALLAAVQMNTIELHTWNATADKIERPDRLVIDLDPGEGVPWAKVQEAAQLTRTLLTELALVPFLKTSGGKGLHVVVPIKRLYDWDAVKDFSRALTEHLARLMPDRFTAISGPKNRVGRIYPDYLRNGRGATTAAAWSARARPGMGVSVPIGWDELARVTGGAHWTVGTIEPRLRIGNAPWGDWASAARPIGAAARRLNSAEKR